MKLPCPYQAPSPHREKILSVYGDDRLTATLIAVVDQLDGDILDAQKKLFKLRRDIDVRIEPVLLEETRDQSGFLRKILSTGYVVYQEDKPTRSMSPTNQGSTADKTISTALCQGQGHPTPGCFDS